MKKQSVWPAILIIVLVYVIAAIVEPCDGHSCNVEVVNVQ